MKEGRTEGGTEGEIEEAIVAGTDAEKERGIKGIKRVERDKRD